MAEKIIMKKCIRPEMIMSGSSKNPAFEDSLPFCFSTPNQIQQHLIHPAQRVGDIYINLSNEGM